MTPNPNPSPELKRRACQIGMIEVNMNMSLSDIITLGAPNADVDAILLEAAALSPQTLPAPGEGYKLPCDVHLPPATVIRAGCDLSTLKMAMEYEGRPRHFEGNPRTSVPTDALATVAAANDEGVAEHALTRRAFAIVERMAKWDGSCAIPGDMREVQSIAAAIRLLSQGGGK